LSPFTFENGFVAPAWLEDVTIGGNRWSPRLTVGVTPVQGLQFYGTYSEGYRAPTLQDVFRGGAAHGSGNSYIPNLLLQPEVAKSWEAGVNIKYDDVPATARGSAFIEVANAAERQAVAHPEGVAVHWIHRDGVPAGEHEALLSAVSKVEWPVDVSSFGRFAAEAEPARKLRDHWRETMSFGRDRTLAVGYWRRGASGVMAG